MNNSTPLFMKNIEFIRDITKISQDRFCGRLTSWNNQKRDWEDLSMYKKYNDGVLSISTNTYTNYLNGTTSPDENVKGELCADLNELRKRHPILKKCFKTDITYSQLFEHDLKNENDDITSSGQFYTEKFIKNYLCYYSSTKIEGKIKEEEKPQIGVLQITKGNAENEFNISGIFSLKKEGSAQKIYYLLQEGKKLKEAIYDYPEASVFTGKAYLSMNLLWCNLSDKSKSEHASFSFDLSSKITVKHPEKTFYGARGIALSLTSGISNQATTFPIVIISEPLSVSYNELTKYLHFNYAQIDDNALEQLSIKAVRLMTSLLQNEDIDETLKLKLISQIIDHELKNLLSRYVFNSHYYSLEEMSEFYSTIIKPLREKDKK